MQRPFLALLALAALLPTSARAGGEGNIWYFGNQAGVDFNSGSPVALTDGQLVTNEGCSSIADADGNLLFYTDGSTIWNRDHMVMQVGLLGNASATHSAIIVPVLGSATEYYVIAADALTGASGLTYSIVDMAANGGLGAVTMLNQTILAGVQSEKLAIARHANGTDLWLLSANLNNQYLAFPITEIGIDTTPVVTTVINSRTRTQEAGYLKVGPDDTAVVAAYLIESLVELLAFDNASGQLVLLEEWSTGATNNAYGVEFSPDGSLFYLGDRAGSLILQYDLDASPVSTSGIVLANTVNNGAISIGPDGKLYVAKGSSTALDVIDRPNIRGAGATYVSDGVDLAGRLSTLGLPSIPRFLAGPDPPVAVVEVPTTTARGRWALALLLAAAAIGAMARRI